MAEYLTHNERETEELGCRLAGTLPGGTVVAMYGDLGAGKTAFVRGMARGMGLDLRPEAYRRSKSRSTSTRTASCTYPQRISAPATSSR